MKQLEYWGRRYWRVDFDEERILFSKRLNIFSSISRKSGWALRSEGEWYAVVCLDHSLWLCGEKQKYDIGVGHCVLQQNAEKNDFVVFYSDKEVLRHSYSPPTLSKRLDPTFDDLDAELEDFFLWISRLWGDKERIGGIVDVLSKAT